MRKPQIVIEHLEPRLSDWLLAEYSHAAEILDGNLLITNVKLKSERRKLSKFCRAVKESVAEVFDSRRLLVLDPQAEKSLSGKDFSGMDGVVIGGILGDDPPLGRTKKLLTDRLPGCRKRNIGESQFSIDGSVFVVREIMGGRKLRDIPVVCEVEIPIEKGCSIILPFAYPLVDGKPLISWKLLEYLKKRGIEFY
ncbi:MAG: SAM-dependent methyltransferase [Candidatus Hadarchaeales archaeon]